MAANVIEEFLVSLGFKVDTASMAGFHKGIEIAITSVKILAAAAATMAVAIEEAVRRTANNYEKLYYISQQTGAMVTDLRNLQFAFEQIGLSGEQATGMIQRLASAIRDNPSLTTYIGNVTNTAGIKNAQQALEALTKEYNRVIRAGEQEYVIRQAITTAGLDPDVLRQSADNLEEQVHWARLRAEWVEKFNLSEQKLAANSKKFNEERGRAWTLFSLGVAKLVDAVMPAFTRILDWIGNWLEREGIAKITKWGEAIEQWLADPTTWKRICEGFQLAADAARGLLFVLEKTVEATAWLVRNMPGMRALRGAVAGLPAGPAGVIAGASGGWLRDVLDRKKADEEEEKRNNTGEFGDWSPRPHTYGETPLGGAQGSASTIVDLLAYMNQGFQHWWAGSNAFRPLVQFAEDVYDKLVEALRDGLGLGPGTGTAPGGGPGGGGSPGGGPGGGGPGGGGPGGGPGGPGGGGPGGGGPSGSAGQWYTGGAPASFAEHGGFNFAGIRHPQSGFRTYANEFAGVADAARLLQVYSKRGDNTWEKIFNKWAPPSDNNNTELLIKRAAEWSGVPRNQPMDFNDPKMLAIALGVMNRNEFGTKRTVSEEKVSEYVKRFLGGEGPPNQGGSQEGTASAGNRQEMDPMAPAGTRPRSEGLTTITTASGVKLQVASEFAENFRGFLNDYDKAGGVIGPESGGVGGRPGNASYHPQARAIDVNQVGYGVRSQLGRTLPQETEDALALKWGLYPGSQFQNRSDIGHFEVRNAAEARAALQRMKRQQQQAEKPQAMNWLKNGGGDFSMAGLPMDAQEPPWSYDPGDRPQRETKVNTANNTTNHISVSGVEDPDRAAKRIRQEMENLEKRYAPRTHQTAIA